jgi:hypothetical protein
MLARWVRLVVAFATAVAVWAIATPARAEAPLCDPRGATGVAPPPQLQMPMTSIDVSAPVEDCSELISMTVAAEDGRAPEPAPPSASQDPVVVDSAAQVPAVALSGYAYREEVVLHARPGERSRVDRPPRG